MHIPLKCVKVANRFRKDLGDLSALKKSMSEVGLLQPIGVTGGDVLIFGQRRLQAAIELGWKGIDARVVNLDDPLLAEFDENECRKPFTVSERCAIVEAIEAREAERAKERQREAGKQTGMKNGKNASEKFSQASTQDAGRAKAKAAAAVGMSRPTLAKAQKVIELAATDPSLDEVLEEMDRTGKVDPAYKKAIDRTSPARATYDDQIINTLINKLVRAIEDRAAIVGQKDGYRGCVDAVDVLRSAWNEWKGK